MVQLRRMQTNQFKKKEERKCDVEMKDDLSERQVPESSASVMNDLIQENPDAMIVEKRKPERAVVSHTTR